MVERPTVQMHRMEYDEKVYVRVEDVRSLLQAELLTLLDLEPMVNGAIEQGVVEGMKDVYTSMLKRADNWETKGLKVDNAPADTKSTTDPKDTSNDDT